MLKISLVGEEISIDDLPSHSIGYNYKIDGNPIANFNPISLHMYV